MATNPKSARRDLFGWENLSAPRLAPVAGPLFARGDDAAPPDPDETHCYVCTALRPQAFVYIDGKRVDVCVDCYNKADASSEAARGVSHD